MRSFIPLLTLTGLSAAATLRPIRQRQPVFDDLVDTLRGPYSDSQGWIPDPWNDRVSSTTNGAATPTDVPTVDVPATVPDVTDGGDGDGDDGGDDGGDADNDGGDGGNEGGDGGDNGTDDGTGNGPNTPVALPNIPGGDNGGSVTLPALPGGGNPDGDDDATITVPDFTGGNPDGDDDDDSTITVPDLPGGDSTDGTDGTGLTDGTDLTDGSVTILPATPVTPETPIPVITRPINGSVPIRFPAAGQAESCLSDQAAEVIIDAYVRMISKWNDEDAYYLSDNFYDTSDSINSLAGIPLGTVTFPSKEAFIEHQHVMPDNLPLIITHKIVDWYVPLVM